MHHDNCTNVDSLLQRLGFSILIMDLLLLLLLFINSSYGIVQKSVLNLKVLLIWI